MTKLVRNHSHWGAFLAEVEDGRVVGVRPFERDPDPSPLIEAIPAAVHSKTRIAQPFVREGWLKAGPGHGEGRGREPFVPVSWERALDLVAGELLRVKRDHGHDAIMAGSQGWGSAGIFHEPRGQLRRFMGIFGGFIDQVSNYSFGTALVFLPHVLGNAQACTGPLTSWSSIARHSKLMVMFGGANPKNMQVTKGGMGAHAIGQSLAELANAGVAVVNVSPIREDGPAAVAPEWIAIRPGTDTAMLLALTHTLIANRLHDADFLARYCTGFERVRAYVMGESDGEPKDADWAAPITGIPADTIRALARRMAANRTMISASWSIQRADHGEQPYWAVLLLASCLGQIGLPGGGFGFGYGSASGIAEPPPAFRAPGMEAAPNPLNRAIPAARIAQCLLHPGAPYDFNGRASTYPDIKLVYWAGGNPFHHHQDTNQLRAAFRRPQTVVVHEPWWTATARHADIVLPATTTLERNDIGSAQRDPFVLAMQKAIAPVGEARNDYSIFAALARAARLRRRLHQGRDEMAWLRHLYDSWRDSVRTNQAAIPDFDRFWADGYFEIPKGADEYVMFEKFRADPFSQQADDAVRPHRALLGEDRGLRLRQLSAACDLDRAVGMARRERGGKISAASRLQPAALQAAQPDGFRIDQRPRQDQRPRGDRHASRRRQAARHQGRRHRARAQRPRRLPCRRAVDRHGVARRGETLLRRLVRSGRRRGRRHLRARQRQCAHPRSRHIEAQPGAVDRHQHGRDRAVDGAVAAGARVHAAGSGKVGMTPRR